MSHRNLHSQLGGCIAIVVVTYAAVVSAQTIRVEIDIKPGDTPTTIEPARGGHLPIAILTTAQFDATTVDVSTVRVGPTGTEAEAARSMRDDVNRDGRTDLLLLVRVEDMGVTCGVKLIRLTGMTSSGAAIEGSEAVTTDCS